MTVHFLYRGCQTQGSNARSLLLSIYDTAADTVPDYDNGKIIVRLHHPANRSTAVTITIYAKKRTGLLRNFRAHICSWAINWYRNKTSRGQKV